MAAQRKAEIEGLLGPTVQALGLELWGTELALSRAGGLLRLYIDHQDRPITLVRNGTTGQVEHFDNEVPAYHRGAGMRGAETAPAESGKPAAGNMDYLDIPAFLRRQAD